MDHPVKIAGNHEVRFAGEARELSDKLPDNLQ